MFASREDFTRRSAGQLLALSDKNMQEVANEVFARVTPADRRRETYGSPELVMMAAALFLQLADLAYSIWADSKQRSDARDLGDQFRDALTRTELAARERVGDKQMEAIIAAICLTLDGGTMGNMPVKQHTRIQVTHSDGVLSISILSGEREVWSNTSEYTPPLSAQDLIDLDWYWERHHENAIGAYDHRGIEVLSRLPSFGRKLWEVLLDNQTSPFLNSAPSNLDLSPVRRAGLNCSAGGDFGVRAVAGCPAVAPAGSPARAPGIAPSVSQG